MEGQQTLFREVETPWTVVNQKKKEKKKVTRGFKLIVGMALTVSTELGILYHMVRLPLSAILSIQKYHI